MADEIETKPKKKSWKDQKIGCGGTLLIVTTIIIIIIIIGSMASKEGPSTPTTKPSLTQSGQQKVQMTDEIAIATIKNVLNNYGLIDINTKIANGRDKGGVKSLILSYKSTASTAEELAKETGAIIGAYTSAVKNEWDIDELGVVIGDISGTAVGMWYCSKKWTNEYITGKISMEELGSKVLKSMSGL